MAFTTFSWYYCSVPSFWTVLHLSLWSHVLHSNPLHLSPLHANTSSHHIQVLHCNYLFYYRLFSFKFAFSLPCHSMVMYGFVCTMHDPPLRLSSSLTCHSSVKCSWEGSWSDVHHRCPAEAVDQTLARKMIGHVNNSPIQSNVLRRVINVNNR